VKKTILILTENPVYQQGFFAAHNDTDPSITFSTPAHALTKMAAHDIVGIIPTTDRGAHIAAQIAARVGCASPSVQSIATMQDKLASRNMQQRVHPQSIPRFWGGDDAIAVNATFPLIVKPRLGSFSRGTRLVHQRADMQGSPDILYEERIDGNQATLEGYRINGDTTIIGVVDSDFLPNTLSFSRFDYPSRVPSHIRVRVANNADTFLKQIGFDNGFFNVEFRYDADRDAHAIIEYNGRAVLQFASLYASAGLNLYRALLDHAKGAHPIIASANQQHGNRVAVCVVLRRSSDATLLENPSAAEIMRIEKVYVNTSIILLVHPQQRLSSIPQDTDTFRYAYIYTSAPSRASLDKKVTAIERELYFRFSS
jgi:biotin carboxylase